MPAYLACTPCLYTLPAYLACIPCLYTDSDGQVDVVAHDSVVMSSRLHNTFNEFQMLANTQFIENRVFDEAAEQQPAAAAPQAKEKEKEKEKTREQREVEIIAKFKQALQVHE